MSTLANYRIPKSSLLKNSCGTIQPIACEDKGVSTFPKSINLKVNVIVQLKFELTTMSRHVINFVVGIIVNYY